jgi:hypothetical protein
VRFESSLLLHFYFRAKVLGQINIQILENCVRLFLRSFFHVLVKLSHLGQTHYLVLINQLHFY